MSMTSVPQLSRSVPAKSVSTPGVMTTMTTAPMTMTTVTGENDMRSSHSVLAAYDQRTRDHRASGLDKNSELGDFKAVMRSCRFAIYQTWLKPPIHVLDVACGQGASLPALLRGGLGTYTGIDGSKVALQECAKRLSELTDPRLAPRLPPHHPCDRFPRSLSFWLKGVDLNLTAALPTLDDLMPKPASQRAQTWSEISKHSGFPTVLLENAIHYFDAATVLRWIRQRCIDAKHPDAQLIICCLDAERVVMDRMPSFFRIEAGGAVQSQSSTFRLSLQHVVNDVPERQIRLPELKRIAEMEGWRWSVCRSAWDIRAEHRSRSEWHSVVHWRDEHLSAPNETLLKAYHYIQLRPSFPVSNAVSASIPAPTAAAVSPSTPATVSTSTSSTT